MEKVTAYRFRGTLYASKAAAVKAVDELIGEILIRHARKLVHIEKYSEMLNYLEIHLADFHEAFLLTEDRQVVEEEAD